MMIFRKFKTRINWTKLAIVLMLMCLMFSFSAMAQTKPEKPLAAEAVSALIEELTDGLPDLIEDEEVINAITEKWEAREDLAGKTKGQILNLLFADVKSLVSDKKTQDIVWSSWKEIGINPEPVNDEKAAPNPESKPAPNPATGWTQPKFRFEVELGETKIKLEVAEISGLDTEEQPIEYKAGNSKEFSTQKMPSLKKTSQVILKKGIFVKDNKFWDWHKQIKSNTFQRVSIIIKLLDEEGRPTMVWTLNNAWVMKVDADGKSINSMVIEHQGLKIENKD